jgi:hypothetical protein
MHIAAIMQPLAQAPVPHNLALSSLKYTFLGGMFQPAPLCWALLVGGVHAQRASRRSVEKHG